MKKGIQVFAFFAVFVIIALLSSCNINDNRTNRSQPNVVFILVDDMGLHDLGCTGSEYYETPNIDRLASQSTVFTKGYAASRVCSPSRASIMTGQFTARHGITDWIGAPMGEDWRRYGRHDKLLPAQYRMSIAKEQTTLAEALQSNGYKTFFSGKWHLGSEGDSPEDHGFDINKGGWDRGSPIGGYFSPWENPKLENITPGESLTLRLAKETVDFIDVHPDTPFFAMLSFYSVHGPIQTTEDLWKKYRDKADEMGIKESGFEMERILPIRVVQDNPIYAGMVETTDQAVGMVMDALEKNGIADNTIIIFTSDNGGVASGDAFSTSNLPLRGGKGYQWEGGIREPYFIKVPGVTSGASCAKPVTGADFYPTILDAIGADMIPKQHVDGESLMPWIEDSFADVQDRPLYWHYPHYGNQGGEPSSIVRMGDYKLIHYWEDDRSELYNLSDDPKEQNDLSSQETETSKKLQTQLMEWLQSVNANFASVDDQHDPEKWNERMRRMEEVRLPNLEKQRLEFLDPAYDPDNDWWGSRVNE